MGKLTYLGSSENTQDAKSQDQSKIVILKKSSEKTVNNKINEFSSTHDSRLEKLEKVYIRVQNGSVSKRDFKKTLIRTHPKLLEKINETTLATLNQRLKELQFWYFDLKILITGIDKSSTNPKIKEFITHFKILRNFLDSDRIGKEQSLITKKLLEELTNDDPVRPTFGISQELINNLLLTSKQGQFVKEIALCFGLYRSYINTLASDFIQLLEEDKIPTFKRIREMHPRFVEINKKIHANTSSQLKKSKALDLNEFTEELKKDQKRINIAVADNINENINQNISILGTKKRLAEINLWINDGILQNQYSINKLNNLIAKKNNKKLYEPIVNNDGVWELLKDTEAFLASIESMLYGKSFMVGVPNKDKYQILDVSYN